MSRFQKIEELLRQNPSSKIHAFRSGGGLRVIRIDDGPKLLGYGEHPYLDVAIEHLIQDVEAGHRNYQDVYGGAETHYLTGSSTPNDDLDLFILRGNNFDINCQQNMFIFDSQPSVDMRVHPDIEQLVRKHNASVKWKTREGEFYDFYESSPSPYQYGYRRGEILVSTEKIANNSGLKWWRHIDVKFTSTNIESLLQNVSACITQASKDPVMPYELLESTKRLLEEQNAL